MSVFVNGRADNVHYCPLEHKKDSLLTLMFEDKGELFLDVSGLHFSGRKIKVHFHDIKGIDLVPNLSRELGGFVRIRWIEGGAERTADLFKLDDDVLMGKRKEDNTELSRELKEMLKV